MAWREKESQKVNHAVLKKEGEKSYWDGKFIRYPMSNHSFFLSAHSDF